MTIFSEDSRVKIPALLHLTRLGYSYLSLKQARWDHRDNIFDDVFAAAIIRLNPDIEPADVLRARDEIRLNLQNEDVGKAFHRRRHAQLNGARVARDDVSWLGER